MFTNKIENNNLHICSIYLSSTITFLLIQLIIGIIKKSKIQNKLKYKINKMRFENSMHLQNTLANKKKSRWIE